MGYLVQESSHEITQCRHKYPVSLVRLEKGFDFFFESVKHQIPDTKIVFGACFMLWQESLQPALFSIKLCNKVIVKDSACMAQFQEKSIQLRDSTFGGKVAQEQDMS